MYIRSCTVVTAMLALQSSVACTVTASSTQPRCAFAEMDMVLQTRTCMQHAIVAHKIDTVCGHCMKMHMMCVSAMTYTCPKPHSLSQGVPTWTQSGAIYPSYCTVSCTAPTGALQKVHLGLPKLKAWGCCICIGPWMGCRNKD